MKNQQEFTIKTGGQEHSVTGDPQSLTLRDALMQTQGGGSSGSSSGGKQGGEQWQGQRFRVVGSSGQQKEYGEGDLNKTFQQLGITPGSTIEVLQTA